jgi:hypothetical protein
VEAAAYQALSVPEIEFLSLPDLQPKSGELAVHFVQ